MEEQSEEKTGSEVRRKHVFLAKNSKLRAKLEGKTFLIPSAITVVGIFCGFLAIINAIKGDRTAFDYATKCIGLAIILDGLDGRIARRLNATSAFGREFDSLSDLVAFGVAPALLVYSWAFTRTVEDFGMVAAFVFVVCGATRLARFNVMTTGEAKSSFTGLPIPGAAAAVASIVYCFPDPLQAPWAVYGMLVYMTLVAVLMVSTLPFFSVKRLKITQGNPRLNLLLLSALVALTWRFSYVVVLTGSTVYAWSGVLEYLWRKTSKKKEANAASA